jgi:hypothetical protein
MKIFKHLTAIILVLAIPLAAQAAPKRIMVFGDSNSWGDTPGNRRPYRALPSRAAVAEGYAKLARQ